MKLNLMELDKKDVIYLLCCTKLTLHEDQGRRETCAIPLSGDTNLHLRARKPGPAGLIIFPSTLFLNTSSHVPTGQLSEGGSMLEESDQ